jgi:hypothetical protein
MVAADHNKIVASVARAVLRPLGCVQKGRSRVWLDDHGWWIGLIEFQPSAWSKGSYLNVGACWLWCEKDFLSFDDGYRVGGFVELECMDQFAADMERLAMQAGAELQQLRLRYASLDSTAQYLHEKVDPGIWDHYHAAIACGLTGRIHDSRAHFSEVANCSEENSAWVQELQRTSQGLENSVLDRESFRAAVEGRLDIQLGEGFRSVHKPTEFLPDIRQEESTRLKPMWPQLNL